MSVKVTIVLSEEHPQFHAALRRRGMHTLAVRRCDLLDSPVASHADMQLLALYTVSEKLFRRRQMLIYRVIFLAVGVWRTWTVAEDILADGMSFERFGYTVIGILFLIAGLIPNVASAAIAANRYTREDAITAAVNPM